MEVSNFTESYKEEQGWKVFIQRRGWSDSIAVYIVQRDGSKALLAGVEKDGNLVFSEVDGKGEDKPTLMLPSFAWQLLVDAITDTTPPTKKQAVDAELVATKYHLEDMRKLIFKTKEDK
jgi:hypothetical protein